ncbi:hypothetical protein BCR42DRAFT_341719 [Absidia repens]|uniref:Methyltransferase domain-containing protein n=1 Tax=Absidia repens TaxID=90262 RepID=A0A1X2J2Z3_9FUNG|nr:hypothetical protein BCR42DRAFT_341719 [Absidia repens]
MSGRTNAVPFDSKEYWEDRFAQEEPFDWLLTWDSIQLFLQPYLSSKEHILHLGCGNSLLALQMADCGYKNIVNVDYSANVIEKMKELTNKAKQSSIEALGGSTTVTPYSDLVWITADCIHDLSSVRPYGSAPGGCYPLVIEKSLTDCIACGDDDKLTRQRQLAQQVASVQPPGGYFISISFSKERQSFYPYHLTEKIPVLVPQVNDKPGAPEIYYYLYILQKKEDDGEGYLV